VYANFSNLSGLTIPAVLFDIKEPSIIPVTVGINKYPNCDELSPRWSTRKIGLARTYKKNAEKLNDTASTKKIKLLSINKFLYRVNTECILKGSLSFSSTVSGKNRVEKKVIKIE
jgi:hypothetical protein